MALVLAVVVGVVMTSKNGKQSVTIDETDPSQKHRITILLNGGWKMQREAKKSTFGGGTVEMAERAPEGPKTITFGDAVFIVDEGGFTVKTADFEAGQRELTDEQSQALATTMGMDATEDPDARFWAIYDSVYSKAMPGEARPLSKPVETPAGQLHLVRLTTKGEFGATLETDGQVQNIRGSAVKADKLKEICAALRIEDGTKEVMADRIIEHLAANAG